MIAGHNRLDGVRSATPLWVMLHSPPVIYVLWVLVVVMLSPVCRWFASVKQRRRDPWLSYL
jgi:hypothetical protein